MSDRFPDAETLAVCERYSLWLRQSGGVQVQGRPLPIGVSHGLDFDRFAEYQPGMDLRHLDWSLYARSRRLYVRQFTDEGAGTLIIVLDGSGSMALGASAGGPPNGRAKWHLARQMAAVLAYAALREVHAVQLIVATQGELRRLPTTAGVEFAPEIFRFLDAQTPSGTTDLGAAAAAVAPTGRGGDVVFISDFLDPHGADRGVASLLAQGFRVDLCRIASPGEFDLPPAGTVIVDPEGPGHRVVPGGAARTALQARLDAHRGALDAMALRYAAPLVDLLPDTRLADALETWLKRITTAYAK